MTAAKYNDEILCDVILPFQQAHPVFLWMTARSHRASVITAYKQANYIITEGWSARSPDLNMIEHAWNLLKRAVNARQPALNNVAEVSVAVQEEWNNLDRGG